MKIIDNLIDDKSLKNLSETMLEGGEFPWYYNPVKSSIEDDENFQFTHFFFKEQKIWTSHWKLIVPIIQKLEVKELIRIKANLTPKKIQTINIQCTLTQTLKVIKLQFFMLIQIMVAQFFKMGKKL